MMVIGLTGSIGMGKSTIARQCELLGAKSINADSIVHGLMQPDGRAYPLVAEAFPSVVSDKKIDRHALGKIVFADDKKLEKLENILHPLVIEAEEIFVQKMQQLGVKYVVLDIPLLFETGGDARMDVTMLATAPHFIQRQRVLCRPHMSEEKFNAVCAKQMPDGEKRKIADVIIHTGLGKAASMKQLKQFFSIMDQNHDT